MGLEIKEKIEQVLWCKIKDADWNQINDSISDTIQLKIFRKSEYIAQRNQYITEANNSSNFFDKTILSLSIWILWASGYFVSSKQYTFSYQEWLLLGRLFLATCLWITLYSFYLSEKVHRVCLEKYDLEGENKKDLSDCKKEFIEYQITEKENKRININNYLQMIKKISLWFLVFWVIFLWVFFYSNINIKDSNDFVFRYNYIYNECSKSFFEWH